MLRDNQGEKHFSSWFSRNSAILYNLSYLGRTFDSRCPSDQVGAEEAVGRLLPDRGNLDALVCSPAVSYIFMFGK